MDKSLKRFRGKVLFPEKLVLAEKVFATVKLPKIKHEIN